MPGKYDERARTKAVRLVAEHRGASEWEAINTVAVWLGMTPA